MEYERRQCCACVCACKWQLSSPMSVAICFPGVPGGGLAGFPGWSWLCWHLEDWSVMACRAVLRCSSHSYCPSLLYFSLPLFFQSFVSQDLVSGCHTFLSIFFLFYSFCTHRVPSRSHFHFLFPLALFLSYLSFSHIQAHSLPHTYSFVSFSLSCSMFHSLSPSLSVDGVTVLGRPPQGARLPQLLHVGRRGGGLKTSAPTRPTPP